MTMNPEPLTMYYDGACPLCECEVTVLRNRSKPGSIEFVDLGSDAFDEQAERVDRAAALEVIHGRIGDGPLLKGVDTFIEAYERADLRFASWLLSRRWLRPILDKAYNGFAAHRKTIARLVGTPLLALVKRRYRENKCIGDAIK